MGANFDKDHLEEVELPLSALKFYEFNPKEHTETQIADLALSLQDFSQFQPLIIDKNNLIISGHGRALAAQKLGWESVICYRASHLDDVAARTARVTLNQRNMETGFDYEKSKQNYADILAGGYDINKFSTNFDFTPAVSDKREADVDTTQEKLEAYQNADTKQVVVYLDTELFKEVSARLEILREKENLETNSDALIWLLAQHGLRI